MRMSDHDYSQRLVGHALGRQRLRAYLNAVSPVLTLRFRHEFGMGSRIEIDGSVRTCHRIGRSYVVMTDGTRLTFQQVEAITALQTTVDFGTGDRAKTLTIVK